MTGKRFRTLIEDREEDDDYGEVIHPIGSTFVVGEPLHVEKCDPADHGEKGHCCGQMYAVLWEQAVCVATGEACTPELCVGMWTIWSTDEIGKFAEEVAAE